MPIYSIDDIIPVVNPSTYIHPTAVIIGDVIVGPNCYIGPNAVMRGDFGRLELREGANLQDTCVVHGFPNTDTVIERHGHIGHGAVIHGCIIGENSLVGMNAVVMDGAVIGAESIVSAGAFVKAKFECPTRSMVVGSPAKVIREVSDQEISWKSQGTREYQQLAKRSMETLREVAPLTEIPANREAQNTSDYQPLHKEKSGP